ncbi:hypothetical protein VPH35_063567 [Triticum aestivum]|uniref:FBD domain-containing protein n=1 Tax=Aegilops tauschii TaxID=37682 RepID=N1QQ61_AEGTA
MPSMRLVASNVFKSSDPKGFNKFVNHQLLLRGHLPLEKCEIWAYYDVDEVDPNPYANLWIQYALICKYQMLDVIMHDNIRSLDLVVPLASERLTALNLTMLTRGTELW